MLNGSNISFGEIGHVGYPKTRRNEGSVAGGTSLLIWFDRWAGVFEGRSITSERLDTYEQKRENESERLNYF